MGKTYLAMEKYDNGHGVNKLISDMENWDKEPVVFKDHLPKKTIVKQIEGEVDAILKRKAK